jgi:hypothetical protein
MLAANIDDSLVEEETVAPLPSLPLKCWPGFNYLFSHYCRFDNLYLLSFFLFSLFILPLPSSTISHLGR